MRLRSEFIDRYVFPGGAVAHLSHTIFELARAGLEPVDIEDLRPHYALTLRHWSRRLEQCSADAMRAAGPARYRIWRVFLAGMAQAFARGWLSVAQVVAYKLETQRPASRPWTRAHLYISDADVQYAGSFDGALPR